jgi:hypothetical protein
MNNYETKALLALTVASFVMLAISLWVVWSLWCGVRRLVAHFGQHMNGLIEKQSEVLEHVANGGAGNLTTNRETEEQVES